MKACYLVGNFGVRVTGKRVVVDLPKGTNRFLQIPHAAGALVDVRWTGTDPVPVCREPWLSALRLRGLASPHKRLGDGVRKRRFSCVGRLLREPP